MLNRLVAIAACFALSLTACSADPDIEASTDRAEATSDATAEPADDERADQPEAADDDPDEDEPGDPGRGSRDPSPEDETAPNPSPEDETAPEDDRDPTELPLAAETVDWTDCGERLQCGTVTVPADYDDPGIGELEIAINVLRSPDPDARLGYLFINPGGPGVPGLDLVANAALIGFPDELLDSFDLVGFDPRGVGESEPTFGCGVGTEQYDTLSEIDELADTDAEVEIGIDAAELCIDTMGPVAMRLHSEFAARDIDEIRKALGAEQINYLGYSYGSALGGWYASVFPDRVRAMVVDGADNPLDDPQTLEEHVEIARENLGPLHDQLGEALDSCADESCPIYNGGDPRGYWYDNVDKFDLVLDAKDGNGDAVVLGVVGHLYTEAHWSILHQSLHDLGENDDPSGFIAAIDNAGTVDEASITAHINCLDSWALFPDDTLDELLIEQAEIEDQVDEVLADEYPLLYAIDLPDQTRACPFYGQLDPPVFDGTFDGGGVPILVIGNTSDPVTPFVKSEAYANEVLAEGRLVRVEHAQHTVYPANNCVNEYVHAALIDLDYPDDEPECALEIPPSLDEVELVPVELEGGATTVRPDGWNEFAPGVWLRANSPSDPVVVFTIPTFGAGQATIGFIEAEAEGSAEPFAEIDVDGIGWQVSELVAADGTVTRLAFNDDPHAILIAAQATPDEIDDVYELVLRPMIDAYSS